MLAGSLSCAQVAGPPSPEKQQFAPLPATVVMIPSGETLRIWVLNSQSAIDRLPAPSTATPTGSIAAAEAGPPSELLNHSDPPPAAVAMIPLVETLRRLP